MRTARGAAVGARLGPTSRRRSTTWWPRRWRRSRRTATRLRGSSRPPSGRRCRSLPPSPAPSRLRSRSRRVPRRRRSFKPPRRRPRADLPPSSPPVSPKPRRRARSPFRRQDLAPSPPGGTSGPSRKRLGVAAAVVALGIAGAVVAFVVTRRWRWRRARAHDRRPPADASTQTGPARAGQLARRAHAHGYRCAVQDAGDSQLRRRRDRAVSPARQCSDIVPPDVLILVLPHATLRSAPPTTG